MAGQLMTTTTNSAPEAGQGFEGNDHSHSEESTVTKSNVIVRKVQKATDIDWDACRTAKGKTTIYQLECRERGCAQYGEHHVLLWGDIPCHTAWIIREAEIRIDVRMLCATTDNSEFEEHDRWVASGQLTDEDSALTVARLERFSALFKRAASLADDLNSEIGGGR